MKKTYIIVIVILIVGAGIGFWLMQNSDEAKTNNSSQSSQENTSSIDSKTDSSPEDPSKDGEYLTIKEWNTKFLIPVALQGDLSYKINESPSGPVAEIISTKFTNLNQSCNKDSGGFIGVYREESASSNQTSPPKFTTIGKYNFFFAGYACEDSSKFQGEDKLLHEELLKNIEEMETV